MTALMDCAVQHRCMRASAAQKLPEAWSVIVDLGAVAPFIPHAEPRHPFLSCRLCMGLVGCAEAPLLHLQAVCCAGLMHLAIHLLWPKMRKRSGRLGGRGAPGSARAAILNTLGMLAPAELAPLVTLFLQPVGSAFVQLPSQMGAAAGMSPAAQCAPIGSASKRSWCDKSAGKCSKRWIRHLISQAGWN